MSTSGQQWQESTVGETSGIQWEFIEGSTPIDFTSNEEIFVIGCQFNAPNRVDLDTLANDGLTVRMYSSSGTTDYRTYRVGGQDTYAGKFRQGPFALMIDPQAAGNADNGTYDPGAVRRYSVQVKRAQQGGASNWSYVSQAWRIGTQKNSSNIPKVYGAGVKLEDLFTEINGTTYTNTKHVFVQQLSNAFFIACAFQIGKSGENTTFDDEGKTFISPSSEQMGDPRYHLTNTAMRVYLELSASSSIVMSGTYNWGTPAPFDFDSNSGASVNITGATFSGMGDMTVGSDVSGSASFNLPAGATVIINDTANLDGSTITGDCNLIGSGVATLTGLTVTGVLDFGYVGTFTLDGCAINEVTNSSGGAVTIIGASGTSIALNTGPSITIENNADVTITGLVPGTRVKVYRVSDNAELAGTEVSGTSFTANLPVGADITFRLASLARRISEFDLTVPATDTTVPVTQQLDRVYDNN